MWSVILFGVLLIMVGFAGGWLWWGVDYHELQDEIEHRDNALKVMREWDQ